MDPTITKASTGNERLVAVCAESQSTSRGPNRTRFLAVQAVIRAKMQCDKKTLLADADASKKRNLMLWLSQDALRELVVVSGCSAGLVLLVIVPTSAPS
jgi:hypothetical protein